MLGRQHLYASPEAIQQYMTHFRISLATTEPFNSKFAEPFFGMLGAESTDSLDVSTYEGATLIHDLNTPIPEEWASRFSAVFDGGTLEHVFNFPLAIANGIRMLKVGGHFVAITPANNQCGHGFYQFSPELYFALFRKEYGLAVVQLLLAVEHPSGDRDWYEVANPEIVDERVTLCNDRPAYLMVIARKTAEVKDLFSNVGQSDYVTRWTQVAAQIDKPVTGVRRIYRFILPAWIRDRIYRLRNRGEKARGVDGLGWVNPRHFKRLEV
jgi:hypothetical protein